MMSNRKSFWMIKPRSFIKLIGADYELMKKAGGSVLFKFYISSFIICIIALLSFLSVRYAIELLFHVSAVEVLLSVFLSMLFLLMYIFLINTFAKDVHHRDVVNLSNAVRTGFIVFMGFIVSKPLEIYVFKEGLNQEVNLYMQQLSHDHNQKIHQLFQADISGLLKQQQKYQSLNEQGAFVDELTSISNKVDSISKREEKLSEASLQKIDQGFYFNYRIKTVSNDYPLSWLLCLGVVLLFVLPGFIVYSISKEEAYFKMKNKVERAIITLAYQNFAAKYRSLFKDKYGFELDFYSKYEDAPFNTEPKKDNTYQPSDEFFKKYASS